MKKEKAPVKEEKKWKGKDWYTILSPEIFGSEKISETPVTDPKTLIGRVIEVDVPSITGDQSKMHMRLRFKIISIKDKTATTQFFGFFCVKESIYRMVYRRSEKLRFVRDIKTKDGWALQVTLTGVLNRKTERSVQKKVKNFFSEFLDQRSNDLDINEFINNIIAGSFQIKMKKHASKIYPVRHLEFERVEVYSSPKRDQV